MCRPTAMISFTRKTDYALVALARLALQKASGGDPLSARAIADEFGLPLQLLMSLMKRLHRSGIINSNRGARGGYFLAREPGAIAIADVVETIEGPARLAPCCSDEPAGGECLMCSLTMRCPITAAIREMNGRIAAFLHEVTLETLVGAAEHKLKLPRVAKAKPARSRPVELSIGRSR